MKRLATIFCSLMLCLGAWASDVVMVGSYTNAHDGKVYDVILEYKGSKFLSLEIMSRPAKGALGTSIVVKGDKKIKKLHKCMVQLTGYYDSFNFEFRNSGYSKKDLLIDPKSQTFKDKYYHNIKWPLVNIAGVMGGRQTNYDRYDIFDEAYLGYNFVVSNEKREMGIIAVAGGSVEVKENNRIRNIEILKSTIHFDTPESFRQFVKLTDPAFLSERIKAKEGLVQQ